MKKILVAVDGSDCAIKAVKVALEDFGAGAEVHLINVQPPVKAAGFVGKKGADEYNHDEGMKDLDGALQAAKAAGIEVRHHICVGDPGPTIARFATQIGAERIVIGSKGRNALSDMVVGSAVLGLLQDAAVPVLVVK
jgi:nucleotide-binding universal stress UspA family protein